MTVDPELAFAATLRQWRPEEPGSWFFLHLPFDVADEIADLAGPRRGFGSVPVEVTIGGSTWRTSVFPSSAERTFVLPVKRQVRTAEGLEDGSVCQARLRLV